MSILNLDPRAFPLAVFEGFETFKHYANCGAADCPYCNSQKMNVRPTIVKDDYRAFPATMDVDGQWRRLPGCSLVVPAEHITDPFDPRLVTWFGCMQRALVGLGFDRNPHNVNTSLNLGKMAGQRLPHLHWWVIDREEFDQYLVPEARDLGMANLLVKLSQEGAALVA